MSIFRNPHTTLSSADLDIYTKYSSSLHKPPKKTAANVMISDILRKQTNEANADEKKIISISREVVVIRHALSAFCPRTRQN